MTDGPIANALARTMTRTRRRSVMLPSTRIPVLDHRWRQSFMLTTQAGVRQCPADDEECKPKKVERDAALDAEDRHTHQDDDHGNHDDEAREADSGGES